MAERPPAIPGRSVVGVRGPRRLGDLLDGLSSDPRYLAIKEQLGEPLTPRELGHPRSPRPAAIPAANGRRR